MREKRLNERDYIKRMEETGRGTGERAQNFQHFVDVVVGDLHAVRKQCDIFLNVNG